MDSNAHKKIVMRDQQGMSLLEIMLALLILGTVVSMVSISLSGSLNILNATRDQGEIYHKAQVALLRISEDLSSTVLVDDADFVGGGEDESILQFSSTAHVVFNRETDNKGIALISYSLQEDPQNEGELVLIRTDELLATAGDIKEGREPGAGFLLSDRLRSVKFVFIDDEGEEQESWTTVDDGFSDQQERKLPVAVSCVLEFWVDQESDFSIEFSTSVLLPVGLINAQNAKKS